MEAHVGPRDTNSRMSPSRPHDRQAGAEALRVYAAAGFRDLGRILEHVP